MGSEIIPITPYFKYAPVMSKIDSDPNHVAKTVDCYIQR